MKTVDGGAFFAGAHASARHRRSPLRAMIELTYKCNFNCAHCYVPKSYRLRREMTTAQVFEVMRRLREAGCFWLGFTGGEPFMRKDFFKILRRAKELGFEVMINTNGSLINAEASRKLGRLRINKVDITVPAMNHEIFDRVVGKKGAAEKVFSAIKLLAAQKVPLAFKTCVLAENKNEISAVRRFARSMKAFHRLDDSLMPRLDGSKKPYDFKPVRISAAVKNRTLKIKKSGGELFGCGAGRTQLAVTPDGKLKLCLMIDWPKWDILNVSFEKTWERLVRKISRLKPKGLYCGACRLQGICAGCPATVWLETGKFSGCTPDKKAEALAKLRTD